MKSNYSSKKKRMKDVFISYDNYGDDVLVIEFDKTIQNILNSFTTILPTCCKYVLFIELSEGNIEMQIDYVTYKVEKNSLIFIMPAHITQLKNISSDLKGRILAISETYAESLSYLKQQHSNIFFYMQIKKNPLTIFDSQDYRYLFSSFDFACNKIRQHTHIFYNDVINSSLKLFFLELSNLYLSKQKQYIPPTWSRKEEHFIDFLTILKENCKNQRNVKFYAEKLCITTQYLSSILKEQSGKSARQWIQDALIIEAKEMLKMPSVNVKQVSYKLNFPDQSTFGKFFKKNAGISPLTFRIS